MYYHFAILMLFRPFIKLRLIGSGVFPKAVCIQAADAISTLLRSYDQLYTLARTPSFVPYICLASSITHLALGETSDEVKQEVRDLKHMCSCHGFAQRGLNILIVLAEEWQMDYKMERLKEEDDDGQGQSMDRIRALCKPTTDRTNLFCPDMSDTIREMGPTGSLALFGPFPMQGMPLLAKDEHLGDYGFARV